MKKKWADMHSFLIWFFPESASHFQLFNNSIELVVLKTENFGPKCQRWSHPFNNWEESWLGKGYTVKNIPKFDNSDDLRSFYGFFLPSEKKIK